MRDTIEIGDQAFLEDGGEEFGAVRSVSAEDLIVYVENAGEFRIPKDAVRAVHSHKVIFDRRHLDASLLRAIGHAHAAEDPDL